MKQPGPEWFDNIQKPHKPREPHHHTKSGPQCRCLIHSKTCTAAGMEHHVRAHERRNEFCAVIKLGR